MKNVLTTVYFILISYFAANAQDYYEYHRSGGVSSGDILVISYPYKINAGEVVYLSDSANNFVRIDGPKTLSQLEVKKVFSSESNFAKDYFALMLKKMAKKKMPSESVFGGVSRGNSDVGMLVPMSSQLIIDDHINFRWKSEENSENYFHLYNSNDDLILKLKLQGNSFNLYYQFLSLEEEETYYWYISETEFYDPDDVFTFQIAKFIKRNLLKTEISKIKKEKDNDQSLMAFYIENNLVAEAIELCQSDSSSLSVSDRELFKRLLDI